MATTSADILAASATSAGPGTLPWSNASRVTVVDGSSASNTLSSLGTSDAIRCVMAAATYPQGEMLQSLTLKAKASYDSTEGDFLWKSGSTSLATGDMPSGALAEISSSIVSPFTRAELAAGVTLDFFVVDMDVGGVAAVDGAWINVVSDGLGRKARTLRIIR